MPYYRRKYRVNRRTKSVRRLGQRRAGRIRLGRTSRMSSRKSLGLRLAGPATDYSMVYRVVGPTNGFATMLTIG